MRTILKNGRCYTRDQNSTIAEAILMEDGKIAAIGSNEEILDMAAAEDIVIDAEGKTVLPGFYDSHLHLLSYGYSLTMAYLDDCKSIEDLIETLKKYIEENHIPPGSWVEGRGWNETNYPEGRVPNRHDLDRVSTEHMISIGRSCSFMCITNTKALEELGFMEEIPDVEVGSIELDEQGIPTGVFVSEAKEAVYARLPKLGVEKIKKSIVAACDKYKTAGITSAVHTGELERDTAGVPTGVTKEMLPFISESLPQPTVEDIKQMLMEAGTMMAAEGITSVQSDDFASIPGNNYQNIMQAFRELSESGKLPVRVYEQCCLPSMKQYQTFQNEGFRTGMGNDFFRLGPLKLFCDGALGGRTAWLREPYSDDPHNTGIALYPNEEELNALVLQAHCDGMSTAIHCIGDAAAAQAITAIEKAQAAYPEAKTRHGIVHAQILDAELIRRMRDANIIAYIQPAFLEYDLHIAESRVGAKRLENSYHYRKLYDAGICIPFGTDSPVEDFSPMKNIYCAVTGKDYTGYPSEGWHPEKLLTLNEALRCYTQDSAYASFEEQCKGRIAPGYFADIVVMNEDITKMPKDELQNATVYMTMMNGNITYKQSKNHHL